jgi:hypothetical protein
VIFWLTKRGTNEILIYYNNSWWIGINLGFFSMASQSPSLNEIKQTALNSTFRPLLYCLLQEKSIVVM